LLVLKSVGVSGNFSDVDSELLKSGSSLRIVSHEVNQDPDSSLQLLESTNSSELLENSLSFLPYLIVSSSREGSSRGGVGIVLDCLSLRLDLIE